MKLTCLRFNLLAVFFFLLACPTLPGAPAVPPSSDRLATTEIPQELSQLPQEEKRSRWQAFSEARRMVQPLTTHQASFQASFRENRGVRFYAANPGQKLTARFEPQSHPLGT